MERQQPLLEKEELMFMKDEVLGDDMTIRNRLGVVETQLQALECSIAWNKIVTDAETPSRLKIIILFRNFCIFEKT